MILFSKLSLLKLLCVPGATSTPATRSSFLNTILQWLILELKQEKHKVSLEYPTVAESKELLKRPNKTKRPNKRAMAYEKDTEAT